MDQYVPFLNWGALGIVAALLWWRTKQLENRMDKSDADRERIRASIESARLEISTQVARVEGKLDILLLSERFKDNGNAPSK